MNLLQVSVLLQGCEVESVILPACIATCRPWGFGCVDIFWYGPGYVYICIFMYVQYMGVGFEVDSATRPV